MRLIPNEFVDAVFGSEAFGKLFFVFANAPHEIICRASVERPVALACKDIDVEALHGVMRCFLVQVKLYTPAHPDESRGPEYLHAREHHA